MENIIRKFMSTNKTGGWLMEEELAIKLKNILKDEFDIRIEDCEDCDKKIFITTVKSDFDNVQFLNILKGK